MGTSGSGAGGGSGGSGGSAGSGGGGGGAGLLTVDGHTLREQDPKETEALAAIQSVFSRLNKDYISFISGDDAVATAYEALHTLHVMLVVEKSWAKVQARFKVPGDPGCLRALADALSSDEGLNPVNPRLQAPLRAALMDFFLELVGDPVVRDSAPAEKVLKAVNPATFGSTPVRFFSAFLEKLLRQEETGLTKRARKLLHNFSETKAKQLVASFEARFHGKSWKDIKQVGFVHLFRIVKGEPEWLSDQLRRKVKSEEPALAAK